MEPRTWSSGERKNKSMSSNKRDPILEAKEQDINQLEQYGSSDMTDTIRRASKPDPDTDKDELIYIVFSDIAVAQDYSTSWPTTCFLKEEDAKDLCDVGNYLIQTLQQCPYDVEKRDKAYKKLIEINNQWDGLGDALLDIETFTAAFHYEKAPLRKNISR